MRPATQRYAQTEEIRPHSELIWFQLSTLRKGSHSLSSIFLFSTWPLKKGDSTHTLFNAHHQQENQQERKDLSY